MAGTNIGRPSELDRRGEDFQDQLAELYVAGKTRQEIADALVLDMPDAIAPSLKTITRWIRDPRVQMKITALTRERTNRLTRKIDSVLESRLEDAKNIDTETLLKMRRTIMPQQIEVGGMGSAQAAEEAAWDAFDEDPDYDAEGTAEEEPPHGLPPGT